MKTIWKFPFKLDDDTFLLQVPGGRIKVLDVQLQEGVPSIWASCPSRRNLLA